MRRAIRQSVAVVLACGALSPAAGQNRAETLGSSLLQTPAVRAAVEAARTGEAQTLADQIRLCEVEAPPFQEAKRAQLFADMFRALGLRNVRLDAEGNVLGERPGAGATPNVVISAHLDTVFPQGTNVTVRRKGSLLMGPGIGDDCRGLATVLAVARALNAGGVA